MEEKVDNNTGNPEVVEEFDEVNESKIVIDFADFWDKHQQNIIDEQLPQEYKPEYKFVEFDENFFYACDYMGLRDDPKIVELMSKEQVKYEKPLIRCFSDSVYRIDAKG